jgi:hypothetical protein
LNSESDLEVNRKNADRLFSRLESGSHTAGASHYGTLYRNVSAESVCSFIEEFKNHRNSLLTDSGKVASFIRKTSAGESWNWDVLIAGTSRKDGTPSRFDGIPLSCQQRTIGSNSTDKVLEIGNKHRISTRGIEKTGLPVEAIEEVKRQWKEKVEGEEGNGSGNLKNIPDLKYRYRRESPLLVIHEIEMQAPDEDPDSLQQFLPEEPVIAWSISFPTSQVRPGIDDTVEYEANEVYMEQLELEMNRETEEDEEVIE